MSGLHVKKIFFFFEKKLFGTVKNTRRDKNWNRVKIEKKSVGEGRAGCARPPTLHN